jgi:hypothetical protein
MAGLSGVATRARRTRKRSEMAVTPRRHGAVRGLGAVGAVIASAGALAIAMLPLATPASAAGTWTLTLGAPTGTTTTGFVANGTVTSDGNAGFVQIAYEPTGTPITSSSPTTGLVIFNDGETGAQPVSLPVDQLSPNTSYTYELLATEDDNDGMFTSSTGTLTTTPNPTGPAAPINPPSNPSSNGIFGSCSGDAACVNDMNGVRAAQENLAPLSLPSNWSSLTGPEQMFVWTNLERTSRGEAAITNLVNTYDSSVQTGLTTDSDPDPTNAPGAWGSIWAGAFSTVLGAEYGWEYNDGPGGANLDCTTPTSPGCWGHRDNILADAATFGSSPDEMDAGVGTDSGGSVDYDAVIAVNPNPTPQANIVFTWAQEQPFLGGAAVAPTVSAVSPSSGTTAGGTNVTITGTGFIAGATAVVGQGSGPVTGAIALTNVTVVSPTQITATTGGGAKAGTFSLFVTTSGGTSAANAGDNFTYVAPAVVPTVSAVSPNSGPAGGGTNITITGTGFVAGATVVIGQGNGPVTGAIAATNVKVVSSTQITATTGGGAKTGTFSLFVTTTGGTSAGNAGDNFTYTAGAGIPTVTGVSPNTGPVAGGTSITITGTGFIAGATVVIGQGSGPVTGAIAATNVKVVSSTQITATTGGGAKAGTWSLFVATSGDTSAANLGDNFTYH